jgi:hypothetical protein
MADVAQLGLQVDSSQVNSATAALNKLNAASASAAQGADKLASSGAKSETVMRAIDAAAKRAGISTAEMEKRIDANSAAHIKMASAQQTAVKAMVDLSAQTKRTANDNVDLAGKTDKTNSSFDRLANTLTRRVLFAFIAKEIRDLAGYVWNLNSALAATADTAGRTGLGGQKFQGLQTTAAFQGVNNDTFNTAMLAFNQQVDLAKNGLGSLQALLKANGKTVSDTASAFGIVADMVQKAGSESQKFSILQQAGLPATREFAKLMEQGGASINKQADATKKLTDQQLDEAKRIDESWQRMWTNFENWGKRAIVNTVGAFSANPNQLLRSLEAPPTTRLTVNAIPQAPGSRPTSTVDVELEKQKNAQAQQRLGILGQLATVEDQVRQKELELAAAGLNLYGVNRQQHDAIINLTRAQAEWNQISGQAQIGVFNLGKATEQAGHELQSWVDRKLLDPANAQQMAAAHETLAKRIEQTGQSALVAASPLEGLQRLANEAGSVRTQLDQFAVTSFTAVTPALRDMLLGTTSLADGFKNLGMTIVNALTDAIIKITIIKPLIDALQSSIGSSGLGGLLGIGGTGTVANGGIVLGGPAGPGVFAAANGGTFGPGWGVVGEQGPELIKVHGGAVTVIPNHISRPYLPGFAQGGMLNAGGNVSRLPFGQDNAPRVTFNVIEDSSRAGQREQSTSGDGEAIFTQFVDSITAKNAGNPGSATSRILDNRNRVTRR